MSDVLNDVTVIHDRIGSVDILRFSGEIDLASAPDVEDALGSFGPDDALVIDLSGCTYVDSSLLNVLVRAYKRCGNRLHVVVDGATITARVLQITAIDKLFNVSRTVPDALRALGESQGQAS